MGKLVMPATTKPAFAEKIHVTATIHHPPHPASETGEMSKSISGTSDPAGVMTTPMSRMAAAASSASGRLCALVASRKPQRSPHDWPMPRESHQPKIPHPAGNEVGPSDDGASGHPWKLAGRAGVFIAVGRCYCLPLSRCVSALAGANRSHTCLAQLTNDGFRTLVGPSGNSIRGQADSGQPGSALGV
ncbi:hypothetical protein BD779DRAFT_1234284 [Infundibulicybe gibba]|nr:hypothetical protein BD779DRAFT_1234284 [Infundibulicybe gibba]